MSLSRRQLFEAGTVTLAGGALAPVVASAQAPGMVSENERIVRKWFKLWVDEKTNWEPFSALLADDFTFTSAAPDDHISKTAFKKQCWDTQINHIKSFDIELMVGKGDSVFIKYLLQTTNGSALRNVELHRLRNQKIESIECYFGGAGYPTAADAKKS